MFDKSFFKVIFKKSYKIILNYFMEKLFLGTII